MEQEGRYDALPTETDRDLKSQDQQIEAMRGKLSQLALYVQLYRAEALGEERPLSMTLKTRVTLSESTTHDQ